ncbi:methylamine utilization protein [Colwellia sp. MEBiC06753]
MRYLLVLIAVFTLQVSAQQLSVNVVTQEGKPLVGAVVEVFTKANNEQAQNEVNIPPTASLTASMTQINKRFVPHILPVLKGTSVTFPNADDTKHHVYSFSPAKSFELKLYREELPTPILLDKPGIVAMGCNIHDWMSGYIYVAESPYFAQTDAHGHVEFTLTEQISAIKIWHPRFNEADVKRGQHLTLVGNEISFQLTQSLYPDQDIVVDELSEYE